MSQKKPSPPSKVTVRVDASGTSVVNGRGHQLKIAVGGATEGFNPYELLSAALGVCTSLGLRREATLLKAAGAAGPVDAYELQVEGFKAEDEPSRIERLALSVTISGQVDDAARAVILHKALDACTIANTLRLPTAVQASLASETATA